MKLQWVFIHKCHTFVAEMLIRSLSLSLSYSFVRFRPSIISIWLDWVFFFKSIVDFQSSSHIFARSFPMLQIWIFRSQRYNLVVSFFLTHQTWPGLFPSESFPLSLSLSSSSTGCFGSIFSLSLSRYERLTYVGYSTTRSFIGNMQLLPSIFCRSFNCNDVPCCFPLLRSLQSWSIKERDSNRAIRKEWESVCKSRIPHTLLS